MKYLLIIIGAMLFMLSCTSDNDIQPVKVKRTVFVYMAAENSLTSHKTTLVILLAISPLTRSPTTSAGIASSTGAASAGNEISESPLPQAFSVFCPSRSD